VKSVPFRVQAYGGTPNCSRNVHRCITASLTCRSSMQCSTARSASTRASAAARAAAGGLPAGRAARLAAVQRRAAGRLPGPAAGRAALAGARPGAGPRRAALTRVGAAHVSARARRGGFGQCADVEGRCGGSCALSVPTAWLQQHSCALLRWRCLETDDAVGLGSMRRCVPWHRRRMLHEPMASSPSRDRQCRSAHECCRTHAVSTDKGSRRRMGRATRACARAQAMAAPLRAAFALGLQHPPLAEAALAQLERWERCAPDALAALVPQARPPPRARSCREPLCRQARGRARAQASCMKRACLESSV